MAYCMADRISEQFATLSEDESRGFQVGTRRQKHAWIWHRCDRSLATDQLQGVTHGELVIDWIVYIVLRTALEGLTGNKFRPRDNTHETKSM